MKKIFASLFLVFAVLFTVQGAKDDGLVVHYKFDEGEGNIARDSSGNGLDATLVETTWEKFGVQGKAVRLDHTKKKAHIQLPKSDKLILEKEMTLSLYFKVEDFYKGLTLFSSSNYYLGWTSVVYRSFITFSSIDRNNRNDKRNGGLCRVSLAAGTGPLAPFHNVVFTVGPDPDNKDQNILNIYLDGKKLSHKGVSNFPMRAPIRVNKRVPLTIGHFTSAEGHWFSGIIDEVKIYNRVLSADEIAKNHRRTTTQSTEGPGEKVQLKKVDFKPLKNKKVALYSPLKVTKAQLAGSRDEGKDSPRHVAAWGTPIRSVEWFKEQAEKLGCKVTILDDARLSDKKYLVKKNFDTLILPAGVIPFEAEESIFEYLVTGGNLFTPTVLPSVYKRYADGSFGKFRGNYLKNHTRGWYSPFLLRTTPGANGLRWWVAPLGLNPGVVDITGDLMAAVVKNPNPKRRVAYRPLDRWGKIPGLDGAYGDGNNYALGADVQVELYRERTGIGSGFAVYRYYNNLIFGSTLAQLGPIGESLIKGKDGDKYFKAVMYLLESKLPGEQNTTYYRNAVDLHKEWSELGFTYTSAVAALRDASFYAYLSGREWKSFAEKLTEMEKEFNALNGERKTQKQLLFSGKYAECSKCTAELLAKVRVSAGKYASCIEEGRKAVADAKVPAKVPVKHKYGTIPSIASTVIPTNLSMFRGRLFDSIRRIGSNIYSGMIDDWYAEDPQVQKKLKGLLRDHKFVYAAGPRVLVRGGHFNPANGTVKDAPEVIYPEKNLSKYLENVFKVWKWKGKEQFRIGTADETGIGLNYWGSQAKRDLQNHLKKYYNNDVAAMNAHCGTSYKSFDEVAVPVRKPETPAQHAIWEHFNKCREAYLERIYSNFRKLVRKYNTDIDVFALPSTGGSQLPLYGLNYYNATKYQDVSGIDGTCCSIDKEWLFLDLTTKRYLTSEWGKLYQEATMQAVNGQMWQELAGGAWGAEQHVWCFGDDSVNFVDPVNCATIYGAVLHMALKDMRKLDHLILDGKRSVPEVGILFSQASRIHDQGWGWAGGSTTSNHILAVSYYYKHFLSWGRSARVFAEEALVEGNMPPVKVLIVPQAEFLSEKVQKALLDYVKKGGKLIIEGRAGKFDEFGRKSDLIFRTAGVIPAFSDAKNATMEKSVLGIQKDDSIYSPAGKGKVLASYDKENAAILTNTFGKGSITFMGIGLGCYKYSSFAPVLERVLRSLDVDARFKVSDDSLVLREWEYNGDTYLLVTGNSDKWDMKEVAVSIRGKVTVEDYLFGKNAKTSYKDGYTTFKSLFANGGRVFRIKGKIAPAGRLAGKADFKLVSSSGAKDDVKKFVLPYKGNIYSDTPLKNGDYTFSAAILGSGANNRIGNAFLTVSGNGESQRKRLVEGETIFFRMRKKIFSVKCTQNFFMYPFYTVVEVKEVKEVPASKGAKVQRRGKNITLSNDLLSLTFSSLGAEMISFLPLAEREDIVKVRKAGVISGAAPGPFYNVNFNVKTAKSKEGVVADFSLPSPVANKLITQKATLLSDAAVCKLDFVCTNKAINPANFDVRYRPGLQVGGAADNGDAFFVQKKDGSVQHVMFRGQNTGKRYTDSGDWAAVVDTQQKVAWINVITNGNKGEYFYLWEASDFYNMELFGPVKKVLSGESITLNMAIMYIHGLTGVSAVNNLNAAFLVIPDVVNQKKAFAPVLEIATASSKLTSVSVNSALYKDGRKVMDFSDAKDKIAFDLPAAFSLKTAKSVKDLADGEYTIKVNILSANGNISCERKVKFAGRIIEKLSADCNSLAKKLDELEKKISTDARFALLVKLGELKKAISSNNLDAASKIAAELKTEMK